MAADSLAGLGYRALMLTEAAASPINLPCSSWMKPARAWRMAGPIRGLGNEATAEALRRDHGEQYVVVSIGPGGEARWGSRHRRDRRE